jgi:Transglycosylase
MRRKLFLLLIPVVAAVLGVVTFLSAPSAIRWYVADNYPFVTLDGDIVLGWEGVDLTNVKVSKPGLEALFEKVHVNTEKDIRIEGGNVKVDLDARTQSLSGGSGDSLVIRASKLSGDVRKGSLRATLDDMRVDGLNVCFKHARVVRKDVTVDVFDGCVRRDKSKASAEKIEIPVKIPFDIPRVSSDQVAVVIKPEIDLENRVVRFRSASLGPFKLVGPATAKLAEDTLFVDAARIDVDHPWVAPHPAHFKELAVTAPVALLRGEKGRFRIRVGRTTVFLDPAHYALDGEAECNEWLDILPHPLPEALGSMEGNYTGRLSFEVRAKPVPHLKIQHDCKFKCSEEPIRSLRRGTFTYMAYDKDGELFERTSGPNSKGWVALADLPPHIPKAFITLEDPGFYHHKGIHVQALENSLKMNIATGKFVRGGSTITMQLAKNLWLKRHKTVGRKAYEALLTVALEACLSKAKILELYMNVVEYGPNLYGLGPATKHYLDKPAQQLELVEAFYLASLLPRPKRALRPEAGGLDRAARLMRALANSGFISEYLVPVKDEGDLDMTGWEIDE